MSRAPSDAEQAAKAEGLAEWETDRAALLFARPFIAALALRMPLIPVVDDRVPTACTDGQSIWFNPFFLRTLSPGERVFVLAHEVWHCVLLHPLRRADREPRRWNIAIDQEVNVLLRRDGWEMPANAVNLPGLEDLSAEEIYERLAAGAGDAWRRPEPFDVHLEPRPAGHGVVEDSVVEAGVVGPEGADRAGPPRERIIDPDFNPLAAGREGWEVWPGRVQLSAAQLRARGHLSQTEERRLAQLGGRRVDWRQALRDVLTRTIGGERSWSPPARRHVHRGIYLPSLRENRLEACIALDTSASVHPLLPEMLAEVHALLSSFGRWRVRLLWADSAVQREEEWTSDDPPDFATLRVPLGRGTNLRPVFARLAEDPPPVLLYVTDGLGAAPPTPPEWPVLWVLAGASAQPPAPWGEVVWLDRTGAKAG